MKNKKHFVIFILIIAFVLALDFGSKYLVSSNLKVGESFSLIKGIFDITYVQNQGAAFSIFYGKKVLLIIFTSIMLIAVSTYVFINRSKIDLLEIISLSLIISGGVGNLVSRIVDGYVVDFFNCYFWPVFNVADIAICCGCGLLLLQVLIIEPKKEKNGSNNI